MGFNKMYLPEVEELESFLERNGNERFHERWVIPFKKRDAVIGSDESFKFIKQFIESEYNEHTTANKKANKQG